MKLIKVFYNIGLVGLKVLPNQKTSWSLYGNQKVSGLISRYTKPSAEAVGQGATNVADPPAEYITSRSIKISFNKAWLTDESDVDGYLTMLREALLQEIRSGKRIQI